MRRSASCEVILLARKFAGTSPLKAILIWRHVFPASSETADSNWLADSRSTGSRRVRVAGGRRDEDCEVRRCPERCCVEREPERDEDERGEDERDEDSDDERPEVECERVPRRVDSPEVTARLPRSSLSDRIRRAVIQ